MYYVISFVAFPNFFPATPLGQSISDNLRSPLIEPGNASSSKGPYFLSMDAKLCFAMSY